MSAAAGAFCGSGTGVKIGAAGGEAALGVVGTAGGAGTSTAARGATAGSGAGSAGGDGGGGGGATTGAGGARIAAAGAFAAAGWACKQTCAYHALIRWNIAMNRLVGKTRSLGCTDRRGGDVPIQNFAFRCFAH